jgi:hypothetical protein
VTRWAEGGEITVTLITSKDVPPKPYVFYYPGPVPIPMYWRGKLSFQVQAALELLEFVAPGVPRWSGNIEVAPGAEAALGVGVYEILSVEGGLGGVLKFVMQYPANPTMATLQIVLTGTARVFLAWSSIEFPLLDWTWDLYGGQSLGAPRGGERRTFGIMPRAYLDDNHAAFVANEADGAARNAGEYPLLANVMPQPSPALTRSGDDVVLAFISDDPLRSPVNRYALSSLHWDQLTQQWSPPGSIADDGTADFHPALTELPSGDVLAVWENVGRVLIEPGSPGDPCAAPCAAACAGEPDPVTCAEQCRLECKLDETMAAYEIAAAHFDAAAGTWSAAVALTTNSVLDRSPHIATAPDGTALAVWWQNPADHVIGTTAQPNALYYARYANGSWLAAAPAGITAGAVLGTTVAWVDQTAYVLYSSDLDDDLSTADDSELFLASFSGGTWSGPLRLTDDAALPVADLKPQITPDPLGNPIAAWYRGGDLYAASDPFLSDAALAVNLGAGASGGTADFHLCSGSAGHAGLVWADNSGDGSDLYYARREAGGTGWTLPRRLTIDDAVEASPTAALTADGALLAVYGKRQLGYESRLVHISGAWVQIENVPVFAACDLFALEHPLRADLALAAEDIQLDPSNPGIYSFPSVSATVHNLGDVAADQVTVAFFDGDPGQGGTLIDAPQVIAGPLVGGASATASVTWQVPATTNPRNLFVVVDPDELLPDDERANNTATRAAPLPDLVVSGMSVQESGAGRLLEIRVANDSGVPAGPSVLALRRDAPDGPLLATFAVPALAPTEIVDFTWYWKWPPAGAAGIVEAWGVADIENSVIEFDELENTDWVAVRTSVRGDLDGDGVLGAGDLTLFAGCLLGPDVSIPAECVPSDLELDGDADLFDYALLQQDAGIGL